MLCQQYELQSSIHFLLFLKRLAMSSFTADNSRWSTVYKQLFHIQPCGTQVTGQKECEHAS